MLFQDTPFHPHITQILCGDKTETRRLSSRWQMKVGGTYLVHDAANGLFQRKKEAFCRIVCLSRHEERLGDISEESASREGLYSRKEFLDAWKKIHRGSVDPKQIVKVYRFELLVDGSDDELVRKCHICGNPMKVAGGFLRDSDGRDRKVLYCSVCTVRLMV